MAVMEDLALEGFSEKFAWSVFALTALGVGGIFGAGSPLSATWYSVVQFYSLECLYQ